MASNLDPLDIDGRLYRQIGRLLDDMEAADRDDKMSMPQRINALIAVGRIQIMFANLRKAQAAYGGDSGSEVRKYSTAFARANAASRRKNGGGLAAYIPDSGGGEDGDGAA